MSEPRPNAEDHPQPAEPERAAGSEPPVAEPAARQLPSQVMILTGVVIFLMLLLAISLMRRSPSVPVSSDDPSVSALRADLEARRSELNRQRVAMGLPPLAGGSEPVDEIASRLKRDADTLVALAGRFQEMLAEKDREVAAKNAELLRSEQLRQSLAAEASRRQAELQRALVDSTDAERMRADLADAAARRDALLAELASLRQQVAASAGGRSAEDFATLERQLAEAVNARDFLEARCAELESELARSRLFASSENELLPAAVELFRNLRELEGRPDSDLTTAYSSLGVKLGANVLHTLSFATGSSELSEADLTVLQGLVEEVPDGDLVLIVGYASKTGDYESNRKLSSARATVAAESFSGIKRPGQLVQAVYLGQTDRFSSRTPERNQMCEVWRIRKK